MKRKYLKHTFALTFMPLLIASLSGCNQNEEPTPTPTPDPYSEYYKEAQGKTGQELKNALRQIIDHDTPLQYADLAKFYTETDTALDGNTNHFVLFYTGEVVSNKMTDEDYVPWGDDATNPYVLNKEHVWPQSRFRVYGSMSNPNQYGKAANPGPATDIYNVRPCNAKVNGDRSNYFYAEGNGNVFDPVTDAVDPDTLEPIGKAEFRGEIARILFYCATRYEKLSLIEDVDASTTKSGGSNEMGHLSTLLKWHLANAVNDREKARNDAGQEIQGNRNPFVDHPEYACKIYGNYNEATRSVCGLV